MAPMKKITLKEQRLAQRPWITKEILKSMKIRDSLYKKLAKKTHNMAQISQKHKKYRNLIITLQRRSKEIYFQNFFLTNQQNIEKTWKRIKDILAI